MKQTVNFSIFCDAFNNSQYKDNFTYEGKKALFNYIDELEEATSEEIDLDIVALCCDFTEYEDLQEFQQSYSDSYESIQDIENATTVILIDDESFIIQNF